MKNPEALTYRIFKGLSGPAHKNTFTFTIKTSGKVGDKNSPVLNLVTRKRRETAHIDCHIPRKTAGACGIRE
jgi:hypothetical protein